jgi:hypothetical protein
MQMELGQATSSAIGSVPTKLQGCTINTVISDVHFMPDFMPVAGQQAANTTNNCQHY